MFAFETQQKSQFLRFTRKAEATVQSTKTAKLWLRANAQAKPPKMFIKS